MPAASTIAIVGAVLAAGGTAVSMDGAAKQSNEADHASKVQKEKQQQLEAEAKGQKIQDEKILEQESANARRKALQDAKAPGTVLTSPLGVTGGQAYGGKTLLGA